MAEEATHGGEGEAPVLPSDRPATPEGLPEGGQTKFYNAEAKTYDWAAHARDAEWRLEQSRRDRAAAVQQSDANDSKPATKETGAGEGSQGESGLDIAAMQAEYDSAGELSEDNYARLAQAGIPREVVDEYIAGQLARRDSVQGEVFASVGGQETYQDMIQWAAQNLTQDEIEAYNRIANSNDLGTFKYAVEALHGRYAEANGSRGGRRVVGAGAPSSASGGTYENWAQVTQDMRDARYASDPAFRAAVQAKLGRSDLTGVRVTSENIYRG